MVEQHFCLRWNNYRTNITAEFEVLREGEHFVDVTLACDGRQLKAHKVVLSACSPYFKDLLQNNPCSHPIIILRDISYLHMRGLLEFMYAGEVNVSQAHLTSFLHTAESLKVRGLAEAPAPEQTNSVQQAAAAAAAAAAVTNSVADLLALKSSIASLPLVPALTSPLTQHTPNSAARSGSGPLIDTQGLHSLNVSSQSSGLHNNINNTSSNANNNTSNKSRSSDSVNNNNRSDTKTDICGEPLSLTVNNNNIEPKDHHQRQHLRSPSPHQSNSSAKRLKCRHSSESSTPGSPPSYYPCNTHSNGSTADIPPGGDDVVHDLSNSTSKQQQRHTPTQQQQHSNPDSKVLLAAVISSTANGSTGAALDSSGGSTSVTLNSVASLPPSLVPPSSSPQHMQYVLKSEPPDHSVGGSDTEGGGCGGSWNDDSDGELTTAAAASHHHLPLSTLASIAQQHQQQQQQQQQQQHSPPPPPPLSNITSTTNNTSAATAAATTSSGGCSSSSSTSSTSAASGPILHQHQTSLLAADISPPLPHPHHHHQQQHTPHLIHATMPPQESHLAGLASDANDRVYGGLEDYSRSDIRGDRSSVSAGMDSLDPSRCDLRSGSPPLPPSSLPHECQVCGKLISCRRNLWKHMERVHLTNPAVRCSICAKLFKNKYALKDHQRIYHGGLSEPLPPGSHHHQSQANLLSRILADVRPSCPPPPSHHGQLSRPPPCSIISVESRPPRELAPIPHTLPPHQNMEALASHYRTRRRMEDDDHSVGSANSSGGSGRYPPPSIDRPPLLPPPPSPSLQVTGSSGGGLASATRRDWDSHPLFSELHNMPNKGD